MTQARRSLTLLALLAAALAPGAARAATPADGSSAASAQVVRLVTHVPARTLDAVGAGTVTGFSSATRLTGAALTAGGRPEVLTVNMAWCPHCLANSWSLAIALSRFGTLTGLRQLDSGTYYGDTFKADPSFPHTHGLSFLAARLKSSRLAFAGRVLQDLAGHGVQRLSRTEQRAVAVFDPRGLVPIVDVGGVYGFVGTGYATSLLAAHDWLGIARELDRPASPIARGIDGLANVLTAAICRATGGRPSAVCGSPGVRAARSHLPKPVEPPSTTVPN